MKPYAPKPLCLPAIYLLMVMVCEAWGESASPLTASSPTWSGDLEPLLNDHCVKCHGPLKKKGDLDLSTFHGLIRGGESGAIVRAGQPESSLLYQVVLPESDPHMPPKKQIDPSSIETIGAWISQMRELPADHADEGESTPLTKEEGPQVAPIPKDWEGAQVIDFFIQERLRKLSITPTPLCDDVTFQRRLYLDLIGRPPTFEETQSFLRSPALRKREKEVDQLLGTEGFAKHMAELFDAMLMERRGKRWEDRRREKGWMSYLQEVFAENRPWNKVVEEWILARQDTDHSPASIWFLYERENNHQAMAEAVAPVVFGTQIKCAQCHDHPLAHEIKQSHYWGMVAAFNRSKNVETAQGIGLAESAVGGFISFANLQKESQAATLSFLNGVQVDETRPEPDQKEEDLAELYAIAPAKEGASLQAASIPLFSRRAELARAVTQDNPMLAEATVNRLWALLMGRGLVHPVDEMNSKHPASHPQLLDWLARDFEAHEYRLHHLVRSIVLSQAYQRSPWVGSQKPAELDTFAWAQEKPLTAEVAYRSMLTATGHHGDEAANQDLDLPALRAAFVEHFPDVLPVEYNASLQQAMFLSNSPLLDALLEPRGDNLAAKLMAESDLSLRVRRAYEHVLGRWPDEAESQHAVAYLHQRVERPEKGLKQLLWAMLTSTEFLTNH